MDWNLLIGTFPFVTRQIFDYVDVISLEKCTKVCQTWCQFLEGSKFYWERLSENHRGFTPLFMATVRGSLQGVKLMLENIEGDKNPANMDGTTSLHTACEKGYLEIAKVLIDNIDGNKNPPDQRSGWTPLHAAARFGHLEILRLITYNIIEGDYPLNPKDQKGSTPMHMACRNGNLEIFGDLNTLIYTEALLRSAKQKTCPEGYAKKRAGIFTKFLSV